MCEPDHLRSHVETFPPLTHPGETIFIRGRVYTGLILLPDTDNTDNAESVLPPLQMTGGSEQSCQYAEENGKVLSSRLKTRVSVVALR